MAEDDASNPPGFDGSASCFLFEETCVRILGEGGTEACVPYEDFFAFLVDLADDLIPDDGLPPLDEAD